jgi:hypothetical protein
MQLPELLFGSTGGCADRYGFNLGSQRPSLPMASITS